MKQILLIGVIVLASQGWGWGQATQPGPASPAGGVSAGSGESGSDGGAAGQAKAAVNAWPQFMQQLAEALATANRAALDGLSEHPLALKQIGGSAMEDASRLMALVSNEAVLGVHGYFYPPLSMAADIAADAKNAARMPDEVKRKMIPADDAAMKQANATAAQWLADLLGVSGDEPVGVILFWCDGTANDKLIGVHPRLIFVLVKGHEVAKGEFKVQMMAFGNPANERR